MDFIEVVNSDGHRGSAKLPDGVKNLLIDIDGTICEDIPNDEPERMPTAPEMIGAKDKINQWYKDGHIVTFFTSRTEEHRTVTEAWLRDHGFMYHGILFGKPRGGNYHWIDDRDVECTKFTTWEIL